MSNELTHHPGQFDEVIHIIDNARSRAMKAVNAELIQMYWEIGSYVSGRVKDGGWGKSVVADFSEFLQAHYPGTRGFSAQNIWRMKQFYETYCDNEKLSPLVREIPWTSNLLIMTGCKTDEAREFYLRLCIHLDTLFVDEGFGSLDSLALSKAYQTLAGLTEGNRLVGIISHVSELKERIDRQIVVSKGPDGSSHAELIV